jgi:hypothetical protein
VLGNELIVVEDVMAPFAREVLVRSAAGGQTIIVMIDRSKVNDAHQMLMVSLRVGGRALPLAWHMKKTLGAIGFSEQKSVLEAVVKLLPKDASVMLMGDRFYGSTATIEWCRQQGWGWRLRCKQELLVFGQDGSETTLGDCFARGEHMLTEKRACTNIAMLHEEGHAEPWITALSEPPTVWRAHAAGAGER